MTRRILLGAVLAAGSVLLGSACGSSGGPRPDIAFVSSRDGAYQLYGMNADGSRQKRLTKEKGDPSTPQGLFFQIDPAWSPDGRRIAFASKRDGKLSLFVMDADGSDTRRLTSTKLDDDNPSWSPDGNEIVFERGIAGDLYVMASQGGRAHRLGHDDAQESDPAWSPDGRWIAFSRRTPGTTVREIWLVHPDGSGRHGLTHLGAASVAPAWSPDGRTVAFSSDKQGGISEIYVVGSDGKRLRPLTISGTESFEPSWSPDGKTLAFSGDGSIISVDLEGRQDQLTDGRNDLSPVWRPAHPPSASS